MPRLVVSLAADPIERVVADVAFVAFFGDDRPLCGSAGRVDWRLCGRLSQLLRTDRLSGEPGEAALIPSLGGLRAPIVVTTGLGARSAFDGARCRAAAQDAVERGLALRAGSVALALLEAGANTVDLGARMEAVFRGVHGAASADDGDASAGLALQLVATPEERPAALAWMQAARQRGLPDGLEFAIPRRSEGTPGSSPRGARRVTIPGRPLVK